MKLPHVLLAGSLAANLALAVLLVRQPGGAGAFFRRAFGEPPAAPAPPAPPRSALASDPPASKAEPAPMKLDWNNLQVADFATIKDHFTRLGLPAELARAFVAVTIMRTYEQRKRSLRGMPAPSEYWRNPFPRLSPEQIAAVEGLDREARRVVRELLGDNYDFESDDLSERRQYGSLPADKVAKLKKIFSDYRDMEEQMFADGGNRGSPDTQARSGLLAREKRADIERLLTPEELLDYDLRNSSGANRLRNKLGAFEPTEAEFRELFPAFQAVAETTPTPGSRSAAAEMRRARAAAEQQLDGELRRVLGESRYAQWQEANDQTLHETRAVVASLNLPPTVVGDIVAIQKEIQPQLTAIERSRDLTPNQRDAQLGALAVDARARLTRLLGAEGFEAYKRRGGGWLGLALRQSGPPTP